MNKEYVEQLQRSEQYHEHFHGEYEKQLRKVRSQLLSSVEYIDQVLGYRDDGTPIVYNMEEVQND